MSDDVSQDEPYLLDVRGAIDTWLSEENPSPELKRAIGDFLKDLIQRPTQLGAVMSQPIMGLPLYSTIIPNTDTQVAWVVVKSPPYSQDHRHVRVDRIKRAPVD